MPPKESGPMGSGTAGPGTAGPGTVGIEAVGSYLPGYRLAETLAGELGADTGRSLCAPDEDALTLAWEALSALPGGGARGRVASRVAAGLEPRAVAAHLAATGRLDDCRGLVPLAAETGGAAALVTAASLRADVLVVADHGRPVDPAATPSAEEAVAVRFGAPDAAAVLHTESLHTLSYDRSPGMSEVDGSDDPRFVEETLVAKDGTELLGRLCKGAGVTTGELAGVVLNCAVPIRPARWAKQWQVDAVWTPGAAEPRAGRLAAGTLRTAFDRLAEAGPGALVAVLDLGWGGDAVLLRAGEHVSAAVRAIRRPAVAEYGYRSWLRTSSPEGEAIWTSPAKMRREAPSLLRLDGSRCTDCATVAFPAGWQCESCGSAGLTAVRLAREGTVLSHNRDRLFAAPDRDIQMIVLELDGGGRLFGQSVAAPRRWAEVGDRARLVLRRLHSGGSLPHYFWKVDLDG